MTFPSGSLAKTLGCLAAAGLTWWAAPAVDPLRAGLALFVLVGGLWLTQALHLTVTALLVPLLAVGTGVLEMREALAAFAHPTIFLFLGGFALAAALQVHGLDRALARAIVRWAGGRRTVAIAMMFAMTALLSMWMSNTATAALMLPLAAGLLRDDCGGEPAGPREHAFVLLGLAYSASLGGMGTPVGSPPNALAAAQAGIGFADWLRTALPLVAVLLPVMVLGLALMLRPRLGGRFAPADLSAPAAPGVPSPSAPGLRWTRAQRMTVAVFALSVAGWMAGVPLARALGIAADIDTAVALAAVVALTAGGALAWADLEKRVQWGVLLLFGGGLALSDALGRSGASRFLADQVLGLVQGAPVVWTLLALIAFVVFLTELVSNTAAAALLLPIVLPLAPSLGVSPQTLAMMVALSASCAFMLPMATPPNAIVYATEQVPLSMMMRCGLVLNLLCILVLTAIASLAF